ncbi:MAG: cupin domain-containing protein [Anaerolineaceae bacterium]|nr:cupin domain-containing protein [Anaerolineaceae bacterium]
MIRAGFTFNNPLTESHWLVVESDAEAAGMGWTLEVRYLPGANPDILEHRHLTWTETFKIVSGVALYKVGGVQQTAVTGDTIVMAPGQPHIHPWNAGDSELIYHQVTRFAQANATAVQEVIGVFATLFGLAGEGKVGRQGLPKNPLQFVATARALAKYDSYDVRFPIPMQKLLAVTLGRVAEALGYKSVYPEYVCVK